jgi:hypothetical protein
MQKYVPVMITEKDFHVGRVRLRAIESAPPTALQRACGDSLVFTDEEYGALVKLSHNTAVPFVARKGEYPRVEAVRIAAREYLEKAPRCACGKLKVYGLKMCYMCLEKMQMELSRNRPPPEEFRQAKYRGKDHREDTWSTKFSG